MGRPKGSPGQKPGPKPKSTALRILEGNPSNRPLPEFEPAIDLPVRKLPAVEADGIASAEWDRVVAAMPPGLYTAADSAALASYALAWAMFHRASEDIRINGITISLFETNAEMGEREFLAYKVNPSVRTWKAASETLIKMTDRLGLSPGVRSRLDLPKRNDKPDQSKFAGLLGRK